MPETLKRIRDLSAVTDPTGMSFPLDAAALGAAESQRITADAFFTWIASQLDIPVVSGSSGYIQFNTSDELNSSANLFWNNNTNRLGISTTAPTADLDVRGRILADRTAVTTLSNPNQYSISVTNFNTDGGVGYAEMSFGVATDGALIQTLGGVDLWLNRTGNTIKTGGNFVPGTTSSYGLGTTSLRWATAFIDTMTLTNPLGIANGGTGAATAQNARIALLPSMATNALKFLRVNAGETDFELAAAGGGSPGGSDSYVQYNDGGAFGGIASFTINDTTHTLTIGSASNTGTITVKGSSYTTGFDLTLGTEGLEIQDQSGDVRFRIYENSNTSLFIDQYTVTFAQGNSTMKFTNDSYPSADDCALSLEPAVGTADVYIDAVDCDAFRIRKSSGSGDLSDLIEMAWDSFKYIDWAQDGNSLLHSTYYNYTTTTGQVAQVRLTADWATQTHASRKGRYIIGVYDTTTVRNGVVVDAVSGGAAVGINGDPNASFTLTVTGHVGPATTSTYDLGVTGNRWRNAFIDTLTLTNALGATNGGTGQTSYAAGDILYASATNTLSKLTGNASTTAMALTMSGNGSVPTTIGWTSYTSTVTNSDGTLTISPTSGAVVASLNLGHSNTWTVGQIFLASNATDKPIIIKAHASQSDNLFEMQNSGGTALNLADSSGNMFPKEFMFNLGVGTACTTGTKMTTMIIMPWPGKIVKAWAIADTAPTGADLIFDINKGDGTTQTSIWNATQANRLKITAGNKTGNQTSFDTTTFAAGDVFSIDVDQVGSTVAGQDVGVVVACLVRNNS